MFKKKPEPPNPLQPVSVQSVVPVMVLPSPYVPTWLEDNVLWPMENCSMIFLKAVLILLSTMTFLDTIGLLPG